MKTSACKSNMISDGKSNMIIKNQENGVLTIVSPTTQGRGFSIQVENLKLQALFATNYNAEFVRCNKTYFYSR